MIKKLSKNKISIFGIIFGWYTKPIYKITKEENCIHIDVYKLTVTIPTK